MPTREELLQLKPQIESALEDTLAAARWMKANLTIPSFDQDYEFVSLQHPDEYPMNAGRIASSAGWDCATDEWEEHFEERQVDYSNAYQAVTKHGGGPYLAGPMARFNLNFERLRSNASALAKELGITPPVRNPYLSMFVRMIELAQCCEEALAIIGAYERPKEAARTPSVRAGEGAWTTEAPRGLLYHRYRVGENGVIEQARIIPPTSQNQARIERDLAALVESRLQMSDHDLSHACEFMIRNYDPCISCATHFLSFHIER